MKALERNLALGLSLCLLWLISFCLASNLEPRFQLLWSSRNRSGDVLATLLGDSRHVFANHFFIKADEYFHSGFYPSIFDQQQAFRTPHMAEDAGALRSSNSGDENTFLGKPMDWLDGFSRSFFPAVHTHLDEGGAQQKSGGDLGERNGGEVREILPWLKLSAELDPNRIETYTVTSFWLRKKMGKIEEAEQFLRDGLRANPHNGAILLELGKLYSQDHHDPERARNLWQSALLNRPELHSEKDGGFVCEQLLANLAALEQREGNYELSLGYYQTLKTLSPVPEEIQKRIVDVQEIIMKQGRTKTNQDVLKQ